METLQELCTPVVCDELLKGAWSAKRRLTRTSPTKLAASQSILLFPSVMPTRLQLQAKFTSFSKARPSVQF
eukprot:2076128-Pleurochrysis_carterae.AAC.1